MSDPKLKAGFWVRATLRQCSALGLMAVVARKGDEDSGAILVKVNRGPLGFQVYSQVRDSQSRLAWLCTTGAQPVAEPAADQVIAKAVDVDWDIWVVEIEDRSGATSILENILGA